MNKKKNINLKHSNKNINANQKYINPQNNPKTRKEIIKKKLMENYNISEEEAEVIFNKLKFKLQNENNNLEKNDKTHQKSMDKNNNLEKNDKTHQKSMDKNSFQSNGNVDTILSNIIPDYNKQTSIEVKHVSLTFTSNTEKIDTLKETFINIFKGKKSKKIKIEALKDINFKIYKGEKVGIIGYNGAGKSTLLHVICGAYIPDKGEVETHGKISPLLSLGAGFDYNYSGRRNIFFNGAALGYTKEFLKEKEQEIIEFSELGEFIDMPIKNYSSGMLAKLGFSIATIVTPDILIIDEVLGVGDVNFAKKSNDKIKSLMDEGTTVLLVSHSIPQIRQICDKAIWIDHGEIREVGDVNEVCDKYLKDSEKASNEQLADIQFK